MNQLNFEMRHFKSCTSLDNIDYLEFLYKSCSQISNKHKHRVFPRRVIKRFRLKVLNKLTNISVGDDHF